MNETADTSDQPQAIEEAQLLSELDAILTPPDVTATGRETNPAASTPEKKMSQQALPVAYSAFITPDHQQAKQLPSLVDVASAQQVTPSQQQIPALADETTPHSQLSMSMVSSTSPGAQSLVPGLLPIQSDESSPSIYHDAVQSGSPSLPQETGHHKHVTDDGGGTTAIQSPTSFQADTTTTQTAPRIIVPIIPDDPDDEIIFDASPQSQSSPTSFATAAELDSSKIKSSYDTTDTPGTRPVKSYSADSNDKAKPPSQKKINRRYCVAFATVACLAIIAVAIWAIVNSVLSNDDPDAGMSMQPSTQPSVSSAPTAGVLPQPSRPPTVSTIAPTIAPQGFPATSSPSVSPSTGPTALDSLAPTPLGAISFNVPYDIFIPNGTIDNVPHHEYIPALIESMDLLTYEIVLNIDENGEFIGDGSMAEFASAFAFGTSTGDNGNRERRKLATAVLLPTQVSNVEDIDCPGATVTDLCQRLDALITLSDADDTWRQFRATTQLAIQIGLLQFQMERVDPNSPVEVIDALWTPPPQVPETPAQPSSCTLLDPCSPDVSPTPESSQFPSDLPSMRPSSQPSIPSAVSKTSSPTIFSNTITPSQPPISSESVTPSTPFDLLDLLVRNSFDDGLALSDQTSPQYRAYIWLQWNEFQSEYPEWRILQRYALATLYFSSNGGAWLVNDMWLTNQSECEWYSKAGSGGACNSNNEMVNLELDGNNLDGTIPPELGLLSELERLTLRGGPEKNLSGTVPSELGFLTNLQVFFVRENGLGGLVPSQIGRWARLEQLDLSRNKVSQTCLSSVRGLFWAESSVKCWLLTHQPLLFILFRMISCNSLWVHYPHPWGILQLFNSWKSALTSSQEFFQPHSAVWRTSHNSFLRTTRCSHQYRRSLVASRNCR
jgi:hypothetical protein